MKNAYTRTGLLRIDVEQGYIPPFGYGLAYWRYDKPVAVCYPLGLNWIVWILREIHFRIRTVPKGFESRAYKTGFNEGLEIGKDIMKTDFRNAIDEVQIEMRIDIWDRIKNKLDE
jgi:hypothetical protein